MIQSAIKLSPRILGLLIALCPLSVRAQEAALAKFGDTVQVLGQMERTDQDFTDGLALDLFSPTNRTLVVTNNTAPLPGQFVTGSSGESFMNLSPYSWIIKMNEPADDLIAKIELPYDPVALQQQGMDISNTYVGTLAADGKSWVVSEQQRNVHISENKTRIIKMTSLDGEYMLLGRKSLDTSNIFVQYGQGATRTVNMTGGPGVQEAEFVDGLRVNMQSMLPATMNVDIPNGIDPATLPAGSTSLNSFSWVVNTTAPPGNVLAANMVFPVNQRMLAGKATGCANPQIMVARRPLNAGPGEQFAVLENQRAKRSKVTVSGVNAVDGQYAILVVNNAVGGEQREQRR
ncbi:unnamed protein product [Discula destructiva]